MSRAATSSLLAVGLIGGAVAAPYWFGARIQSQFEEGIAKAPANPSYQLALESYDRGWRTSEAVMALTITAPDEAPVALRFTSHIEHGPIAGGLRQAHITTTAALPPEIAASIGPLFGAQPPLVAVLDIGFTGAVNWTIESPAANGKTGAGNDIAWQGLRSQFHVDGAMTEVDFTGEAPGLAVGPSGTPPLIQFAGLRFSGTGAKSEASGLWLSAGTFELAQLGLIEPNGGGMIQVRGLRTHSSSEEKDGAIQVALALAAAEATTGDGAVRDFALDFSLHDVDAVAMKKLQEFIEANGAQAGLSDEQRGQLVVTQMQALSGELLARKPSLAIDRLNFIYQDEPFTATARVQYVGSGNIAAFNPISDVVGSVSFEAPQSAVQRVVETRQLNALRQQHAQRMIASGVVSEPRLEELGQMEAQAKAISGPVIQDLIAQQTLLPAGGNRLKAEAKIESGRITLNGRPWISLPVPGGAEPAPTW